MAQIALSLLALVLGGAMMWFAAKPRGSTPLRVLAALVYLAVAVFMLVTARESKPGIWFLVGGGIAQVATALLRKRSADQGHPDSSGS